MAVGFHFKIYLASLPAQKTRAEQEGVEQQVSDRFDLETHLASGLLQSVKYYWSPTGRLLRIHLVPHPRIRRTPGIADLEWLFYREAYVPRPAKRRPLLQRNLRRKKE